MCVCAQLAKLWLQHLHLKEEEAVDKKELLQLWQQMAQLLLDCLNEEGQQSEIQQHVSCPHLGTVFALNAGEKKAFLDSSVLMFPRLVWLHS